MTPQEMVWFNALVKDREENARILAKDSMAGYRQSPIDKYSDRAHFVYELLQNADDVKASRCKFSLSHDRLLFMHDGSIHFKVSDPNNEGQDRRNGRLGGVNAITAAGLSTKSGNEIGRFGIGFKAVFQYTDEPRIYDDNVHFGLRREVVPHLLGNDLEGRKQNETCFYIPFRDGEKRRAYSDIQDKIVSIMYPLLFLSNLKEISFESSDSVGLYSKVICDKVTYKVDEGFRIDLEFLLLKKEFDNSKTETKVLKFTTETKDGRVSVVFGINNDSDVPRLEQLQGPAFCFFPTKKDTGLNFLIHAPFLLNDSREGIKAGLEHNDNLIISLACLSVNAVELMVSDIPSGTYNWFGRMMSGVKLIDDGILDFVPLNIKDRQDQVSFLPFTEAFMAAYAGEALIPYQEECTYEVCYQKKENACWSTDSRLIDLLTPNQLKLLLGKTHLCWGFASIDANASKEKRDFVQACCGNILNWSGILPKLTIGFFEQQPISWFKKLFDYISYDWWNIDSYKTLPMFLDSYGKAVAAFDEEGNHILYLPSEDNISTSKTINPELMNFTSVQRIIKQWNIKAESSLSIVQRIIKEDLVKGDEIVYAKGFVEVLKFCNSCSDEDLHKVGEAFKKHTALQVYNPINNKKWRSRSTDSYYPTDDLLLYFKECESTPFVDLPYLKGIVGGDNITIMEKLLSVLEVWKMPKYFTELRRNSIDSLYGETRHWHYSYRQQYEKWEDLYLDRSCSFFKEFQAETNIDLKRKMSVIYWNFLCQMIGRVISGHSHIEDKLKGVHHYYYDHAWRKEEYETILYGLLKNTVWLFNNQGVLVPHANLFVETMDEMYDVESSQAKQLFELLGIKHDARLRAMNVLSDEERQDLSLAKDIREACLCSLSEAKNILEKIPDEIRRKINSGQLTATDILKAIRWLEQSKYRAPDTVVQDCKVSGLNGEPGSKIEAPILGNNIDNEPMDVKTSEKHKAGDYELQDGEYEELTRLFEDGLTGEGSNDADERKKDESKLACLRLFKYLESKDLEPSMDGHCDIKYVVTNLYNGLGKTGPNIDVNTGEKWHVISAMGGVAYIPPRWWQKIVNNENGKNVICAVTGATVDDFKVIRGRSDVAQYVGDNAVPIKIRGRDADDRIGIVSNAFCNVDADTTAGKIYALLKLRDKTSMNSAFEKGYCSDEMSAFEASHNEDL